MSEGKPVNVCGLVPWEEYVLARDRMQKEWKKANWSKLVSDLVSAYATGSSTLQTESTVGVRQALDTIPSDDFKSLNPEQIAILEAHQGDPVVFRTLLAFWEWRDRDGGNKANERKPKPTKKRKRALGAESKPKGRDSQAV